MLRGIHKASSTWLGKGVLAVIMGFLILSFAVWGIGDIFRGFGLSSAVKIGKTEISIEQFREFYNERLRQFGRRLGRPLTPDQARALGLDQQALRDLIAETTLDEQAKALRLGVTNADIVRRITSDPNFRGPTGKFDQRIFEGTIRQAGYTEARFIDVQRNLLLRRQIAESVGGDLLVPATAMKAMDQYQNEKRTIEYLTFGPAQAGSIAPPTQAVLQKYFDERKVLFRAPEYRKISLMPLAPADVAKPEAVSDADAKQYYESRKGSYGTPEQREVRQMVFQKPEEAAAARERIAKGLSFADLAKERGLKDADTDLGMVKKSSIIDPAVADAAFSLKSGEVSQPISGRFGTVLVQIGKTEPGTQKTYEDVAPQIKREIAEERAKSRISDLRDKFEDERAAGSTLAEAAKKLGIKFRTIDAVDRSGRGPNGQPVPDLPRSPDVAAAAFASDIGVDNEPLQLQSGGYLWYDVTSITPARDRTLEEVKDKVETSWRNDEIAKRLKAKTEELVGKLKAGGTLAQLASETALTVQKAADLQRRKPAGFVPPKVVDAVFHTAKGEVASSEGSKETERFVFRVTDVIDPKLDPNSEQGKTIAASLKNSFADDIVASYIAQLERNFGITLNQAALRQIIGGADN